MAHTIKNKGGDCVFKKAKKTAEKAQKRCDETKAKFDRIEAKINKIIKE